MERRKPISYLSLECIIPYLSPLKRIFDISRITGAAINNRYPYRINHLVLGHSSFSIDGLKFTYRVFKEQHRGQNVEGLRYDVFGTGFRDLDLAPGDIVIGNQAPTRVLGRHEIVPTFVKCTIEHERRTRTLELPVGTKLRDALRSNIAYFLGRNRVHRVANFEVANSEGVLRLPIGLKFHINQLSLHMGRLVVLESIRPIIMLHPASVHFRFPYLDQPLSDFLIGLPHKKVCVSGAGFPFRTLADIVNNWNRTYPEVGTEFSVHVGNAPSFLKNLKAFIPTQRPRWPSHPNLRFTSPLDNRRQVCCYVFEVPDFDEENNRMGQPWIITMRVENVV